MTTHASRYSALIDVYLRPKSIFSELTQYRQVGWLALAVLALFVAGINYFFVDGMSLHWLVEQQMMQMNDLNMNDLNMNERKATANMLVELAPNMALITLLSSAVFIVVIVALNGLYLYGLSQFKILSSSYQYQDWFAFSIWCFMPLAINALGLFIFVLMAPSPDVSLLLADYASLNQLFLGLQPQSSFFELTQTINLFYLWVIAITSIGIKQCCQVDIIKAVFIASLPYVLLFSVWFVLAI